MKNSPPEKRAAAGTEAPTATAKQSHNNVTSQTREGKTYSSRAGRAEEIAQQLVAAIAEHGRAAIHGMPAEWMPTQQLADIAARTLAATDAGARGWPDVMAEAFMDAPDHVRAGFIECTQEAVFPPSAEYCKPLVDAVRAFHRARRQREIADRIRQAIEADDCTSTDDLVREFINIEKETSTIGIGDMLAARAFTFDVQPPRPIPVFRLADMPLCTAGNITNIQAPPKAGKSAVVDAMLAAVMVGDRTGPDTLSFTAQNPHGRAVIHLDTEQSRFDADALVRRSLRRAGMSEPPLWFHSYAVADLGVRERREALRHAMDEAGKAHGGILAVLIDGIGDLCADPNDSEEAFDLVHELHAGAILHDCTVCTVLHENPGSEAGKTRGHLGSQLERKAETNLRLVKDKDGITVVYAEKARHCYLPKDAGPCFAWSDEHRMHVSCGTSGEMRQAANRSKMEHEADAAFGGADGMTYSDLVSAIMDALDVSNRTAKGRVKTWLAEGITRKDSAGKHQLIDA